MKNFIFNPKKLIPVIIVTLFFGILVLVGFFIYKDYGVSSDEATSYLRGQLNYLVFRGGSLQDFNNSCAKLANENSCYYPPLFDMITYRLIHTGDSQTIFESLHLIGFLSFVAAVFVFFLIGKKIFKNWIIALLGCLFLVISPRIFGNAFYNPKDIPFMDAYIFAIFTMLLFFEKKNIITAILHGITTAIACSIRIPGLVILPITFFFYFFDLFLVKKARKDYFEGLGLLFSSVIVTLLLIFWLNPFLYGNPVAKFIYAFNLMKAYPWSEYQLYMGQNIQNRIPWHYSLVWFSISSPPFYVALFLLGSLTLLLRSLKSRLRQHFQSLRDLYLVTACGVLPILVVIVLKSVIYSDNRQMYFCYPALLLVSVYGLQFLMAKIREINRYWQAWIGIILILGLIYPVYFMVQYHTRENVFFNFLAGPSMPVIARRFTMDRWALASKDALEYILNTDTDPTIRIRAARGIYQSNLILPKPQRSRLKLIEKGAAEYFMTNGIYVPTDQTRGTVYYTVKVFDADIFTVIRLDAK